MAKANMSSWDGFLGKTGDMVTYIRMGKVIKRKIGKSNKPATDGQLKFRQKVKIANEFISPVKGFIHYGMMPEGKAQKKTPNDLMLAHALSEGVIIGEYPDQKIDFTAVQFSKGRMMETPGLKVNQNEEGLEFTWDTQLKPGQFRHDDRVMVLVYFPELKSADYELQAGRRSAGKFQLNILRNDTPTVMETYASFMSADLKLVSDSVYLGQFILPSYGQ